jgi:hypothetical protein
MSLRIERPAEDEYTAFHRSYLEAVAQENDVVSVLRRQTDQMRTLGNVDAVLGGYRYAEGKWTVREVIGHLADTERVLSYRLLRIARGDQTPLPGFDEGAFAAVSNADRRAASDLAAEWLAVRAATMALVLSLEPDALARRGLVNNWPLSARALVWIIAGHVAHHVGLLADRYGVRVR